MKRRQRVQAALICLGFVLLVVLTQVFSIHVMHHHCVGESCAVCHQLHQNQQQLTHTAAHVGGGATPPVPQMGETLYRASRGEEGPVPTLISLKVKLSN